MTEATIGLLPYHQPAIVTILVQISFIIVLNVINYVLDRLIYCGLLGQILVGVAWGTPGAEWLGGAVQEAIVQVGYLGLVLLVYEGGLSTSYASLKANLLLSIAIAVTGIGLPIAFSFSLRSLAMATPLQAFTAGAALCSTSLGATFTILGTTGLTKTRIGTVLTSAATLDDVVGLVLVEVISNLGSSTSTSSSKVVTVIRPIAVALGLVIMLLLFARFINIVKSAILNAWKHTTGSPFLRGMSHDHAAFISHTLILFVFVASATYAGTSGLFAAYLAGLSLSWWDSEISVASTTEGRRTPREETNDAGRRGRIVRSLSSNDAQRDEGHQDATNDIILQSIGAEQRSSIEEALSLDGIDRSAMNLVRPTGLWIYGRYYSAVVERVLKPFFFASIGFSIPIRQLFEGDIVWRGLVYTILMLLGKLLTGLWLVRISKRSGVSSPDMTLERQVSPQSTRPNRPSQPPAAVSGSLYPASVLGSAMVTRGEIGFLIASLAESQGIFTDSSSKSAAAQSGRSSRIYLVMIWAITLCTIIGPITMGLLVQRVKTLQSRHETSGGPDPLGIFGV
ncbi:hypothetical protein MMC22_008935 [Lobaria immixta]|nr:hypothetical protein [Lobaria immixta]